MAFARTISSSASYSEAEKSKATTQVCAAYDLALAGVSLQTNAQPTPDPAATAANARLALLVAALDLRDAVDSNPAAPSDLRDSATALAHEYGTISARYLAGDTNDSPEVAAAIKNAGTASERVGATCKSQK